MAGKRLGVLKVNEYVGAYLEDGAAPDSLHPRHLPMLVPPKPWTSHESGGYYRERTSAMRFKDSAEQNSYLKKASERGDLDNVLAGLDVLGRTPWRINRRVFDVMGDVWNQGIAFAKIPPRSLADEEPQPPANYETDMKAKNEYLQKLRFWAVQQATNHGLRCDINYKLEIARAFIGERFYFPHNIDFRGRAYPIPPNFNHIGNDLCRGLLKFDVAKPLGTSGLRWLRIHLANLYGFDKASFSEREQWAIDHEAQIRESAENPLNGSRWWLKAGDPWQCLATCMELIDAYDHRKVQRSSSLACQFIKMARATVFSTMPRWAAILLVQSRSTWLSETSRPTSTLVSQRWSSASWTPTLQPATSPRSCSRARSPERSSSRRS